MDSAVQDYVDRWQLTDLRDLAETPTSRLWRAIAPGQGEVVFKHLKPRGAEERVGFTLAAACKGRGMVRILQLDDGACLMDHLPGPSLGDLVRAGQDEAAAEHLAGVAAAIRSVPMPDGLTRVEDHLAALTRADFAQFPLETRVHFEKARDMARGLFATAPAPVPLHGDLHHDNILMGPAGWLAIDAKGLMGDPAFEFANSFRNPWDRQDLARDPARALRLAAIFARHTARGPALDALRILSWAFVHVAVSACWFAEDSAKTDDDLALLPVLSSVLRGV